MDRRLIAALRHVIDASFIKMLKSYWSESEPNLGNDLADWIDGNSSFEYWLREAPFKKWALKKLKPNKLKVHHEDQDEDNMEDIRDASSPDDIPPIIVDHKFRTVDGAHRLRVAQEDGWKYIKVWEPDPSSRMTTKEIKHLQDGWDGEDIVRRFKSIKVT